MNELGNILIVDDEASLRRTLIRVLNGIGCQVVGAANGADALRFTDEQNFDLIYLDLHLPGVDGLQVLQEVRKRDTRLPVVVLTAYGTLQSAVEALRLGATDYLLKPVDPEVLVARTRVLLRESAIERRKREIREQIEALQTELQALEQENAPRNNGDGLGAASAERFMKRGGLILDLQAQQAIYGDQVLNLPPTSFQYLRVLVRHEPQVVSYQSLVSEAQNYQTHAQEARELSKYHIHVLRQAVEADPKRPAHVLNVRGVGYRWVA